jgi:hypothetical protein
MEKTWGNKPSCPLCGAWVEDEIWALAPLQWGSAGFYILCPACGEELDVDMTVDVRIDPAPQPQEIPDDGQPHVVAIA